MGKKLTLRLAALQGWHGLLFLVLRCSIVLDPVGVTNVALFVASLAMGIQQDRDRDTLNINKHERQREDKTRLRRKQMS